MAEARIEHRKEDKNVNQLLKLSSYTSKLQDDNSFQPTIYFTIKNEAGETIRLLPREFDWLLSWHDTPRVGICGNIGCVQKSPTNKTEYLVFSAYWETGKRKQTMLMTVDNHFLVLKKVQQDMNRIAQNACIMLQKHGALPLDSKWTLSDFIYFMYDLYMCILKQCYIDGNESPANRGSYASAVANLMNESNILYKIFQENDIFAGSAPISKDFLKTNILGYEFNCLLHYYVPTYVNNFIETYTSPTIVEFQAACAKLKDETLCKEQ